ncbi:MAG: hypothetical protein GX640_07185 [Fibrobacter sp.]|nr:hypothetical protein [Fibrobacter sp.]
MKLVWRSRYIWKNPERPDSSVCNLSIEVKDDRIKINSINSSDCSYFCGAGLAVDDIEVKNAISYLVVVYGRGELIHRFLYALK